MPGRLGQERLARTDVKAWCAKIRHLDFVWMAGEPWKGKQEKALGLCCARITLTAGVKQGQV